MFSIIEINAPVICPMTVAHAAPLIPSAGNPKSPKIIIGSRIMFVIAPASCEIIDKTVLPVDCKSLSKVMARKSPKQKTMQISR